MILDSSAIVAMLRGEPEAEVFMGLVAADPRPKVSVPTLLEVFLVEGVARKGPIHAFLDEARVRGVPFDMAHLEAARDAHARYGKGSQHPARLNFGDCISYALAKVTGEPLLYRGDDFTHTDVEPAHQA